MRKNQQTACLEEAGLDLAGAAEGNVGASKARIAVAEDLGVVGLEGLSGGGAVNVPDVDTLERDEHSAKPTKQKNYFKGI